MQRVRIDPRPIGQVTELFHPQRLAALHEVAPAVRAALRDRVVWNINVGSSAGGTTEMVQANLSGVQALGVEAQWCALTPPQEFYRHAKQLRDLVLGRDGTPALTPHQVDLMRDQLHADLAGLLGEVAAGDVVILHDPEAALLIPTFAQAGLKVMWRLHLGSDEHNDATRTAWNTLQPFVKCADVVLVSLPQYAPSYVDRDRVVVMSPSINGTSARNVALDERTVADTLSRVGIMAGGRADRFVEFSRRDNTAGAVRRHFDCVTGGYLIPADARLVAQIGRWDVAKDMVGVQHMVSQRLDQLPPDLHVLLVGPRPEHGQDPLANNVFQANYHFWANLPEAAQTRIHLVALPDDDADEGAHIVNAIQTKSAVILQKSLVEGFGLAVTEAMWKGRPVIASPVGGLRVQITHELNGLLLSEPSAYDECVDFMKHLLDNPSWAKTLGDNARSTVRERYLGDRHLILFADLLLRLS